MRDQLRAHAKGIGALALSLVLTPLALPGAALADISLGSARASGELHLGGQGVSDEFGSAKYGEYRDEGPGFLGSGLLLVEDALGGRYLRARFLDITRRNQEYELRMGRYGRYSLELGLSQLPHELSNRALTLYGAGSDARLSLPTGFVRTNDTATLAAQLTAFENAKSLGFRQRDGRGLFEFRLDEHLTLRGGYRFQTKDGSRPFRLAYGNPGPTGSFVEVALPIDEETREVTAGAALARQGWNLDLEYRGSFFRNELDSVTVDNPFATGPAQGRAALAPDNSSHSLTASAAADLGLGFPARFAGTLSAALHRQDEAFLPHTVNAALAGDPSLVLPDGGLDGEVLTWIANVVFSARPRSRLNLRLRYRAEGHDNRTDVLEFAGHVVNDNSLVVESRIAARSEYTRQRASLDVSYRLAKSTLDLDYTWRNWNRSGVRAVTHQNEHTASARIRLRPLEWAELRATVAISQRRGNDYEYGAWVEETYAPADAGDALLTTVFPRLRKFPQADRTRHGIDLLAVLTPAETLSLTASGSYSQSDFDDSDFGLTDADTWNVALTAEYRVLERLGLSAHYSYDDARRAQRSRTRPRSFAPPIVVVDDPANDWTSRSTDRAHNFGVGLELALIPDRLGAELSWELQDARASTRARGAAGAAVDYPSARDQLQSLRAAIDWDLGDRTTVRAEYRFERFDKTDFQSDDAPPLSSSGATANGLFLRDGADEYEAHILALSLAYRF